MPDKRMDNAVPSPKSSYEDFSGTRKGNAMGAKMGPSVEGLNPKADAIPSGTRSGSRKGSTNTEGPGVTSLADGVKHLKMHHAPTKIHKVKQF
jgi:hypothetical protein